MQWCHRHQQSVSQENVLGKAKQYPVDLKLRNILENQSWGHKIWQAGQTLESLQRTHPGDPSTVKLEEFYHLCKAAEESR